MATLGASLNQSGTSDLRDIIAQKERELHEINEFRLRNLEAACAEKEREVADLKARLTQVKEDFAFNLKVCGRAPAASTSRRKDPPEFISHLLLPSSSLRSAMQSLIATIGK